MMKEFTLSFALALGMAALCVSAKLQSQTAKPAPNEPATPAQSQAKPGQGYSGMYAFLKEGEFVQVTIEDEGRVTGFISRYGEGESDKGTFVDQFFKSGKFEGNKLTFTTEIIHGVAFDFKGTVERGEGKNPGDEAYFVLKGKLSETANDANNKATSRSQEVQLKIFPQDAEPEPPIGK
jgi:hypothetical protein